MSLREWYDGGGTLAVAMDLRRSARAALTAPKRFLDWVYAPSVRHAPTRSQAIVHLHVAATGMDPSRWMAIESEERRHQAALLRARERAASGTAGAAGSEPDPDAR